jgi:hypothetical protein
MEDCKFHHSKKGKMDEYIGSSTQNINRTWQSNIDTPTTRQSIAHAPTIEPFL